MSLDDASRYLAWPPTQAVVHPRGGAPRMYANQVEQKIKDYFAAGVRQVWKIVPELQTLTIYFSPTETKILTENDELTCEEILPTFKLKLSEIFID